MRHIVLLSGGRSSGDVAILAAHRFGTANLTLLNHDICPRVEAEDVKRFKKDVADFIGLPITYANMQGWEEMDQFDVCVKASAFKVGNGHELCTHRTKTEPFMAWLAANVPDRDCVIYYGFDANETNRIQRRSSIMGALGYLTDYPLALWPEKTPTTATVGIEPPNTYAALKHANCVGCLKAGLQHWYIVFCTRPDLWGKAKWAEDEIGYSINAGGFLEEFEDRFERMRRLGIPATEHIQPQAFWASANRVVSFDRAGQGSLLPVADARPCECVF